jgi:lipopolysaccharide export LptBFGC system permease protein LptF
MKILDRYVVRHFLVSAGLWFVVLMALRVVTDLFVNIDEFAEAPTLGDMLHDIGLYYGVHSLAYFTELGGIIVIAAAAFTLARMNHTNELTAMLASGVSLHRVVWPIVLLSMALSGLIMLDQELVLPRLADRLVQARDDVRGEEQFDVRLIADGKGNVWYAHAFDPDTSRMTRPVVLVRRDNYELLASAFGVRAAPVGEDGSGADGWQMSNARLVRAGPAATSWHNTPDTDTVWTSRGPESILRRAGQDASAGDVWVEKVKVTDPRYGLVIEASRLVPGPPAPDAPRTGTLVEPRFTYRADAGGGKVKTLGEFRADSAVWQVAEGGRGCWKLDGGRLVLPSDLSPQDLVLRRSRRWLQYMSISQLTDLLKLPHVPNRAAARLTRHIRVTEPINNLIMLLLGLPFILSRERNIKAAAGLCLLLVLTFYAFVHMCRNITGLPPEWAAWLPILLFGPVAVVMFDSVKT